MTQIKFTIQTRRAPKWSYDTANVAGATLLRISDDCWHKTESALHQQLLPLFYISTDRLDVVLELQKGARANELKLSNEPIGIDKWTRSGLNALAAVQSCLSQWEAFMNGCLLIFAVENINIFVAENINIFVAENINIFLAENINLFVAENINIFVVENINIFVAENIRTIVVDC